MAGDHVDYSPSDAFFKKIIDPAPLPFVIVISSSHFPVLWRIPGAFLSSNALPVQSLYI
jgi:hypothetical protein